MNAAGFGCKSGHTHASIPSVERCDSSVASIETQTTRDLHARCPTCRHTLENHEQLGWSCDCDICPWKAGYDLQWSNDAGTCDTCGKVKDRVIRRRLGTKDARRECDECWEATR